MPMTLLQIVQELTDRVGLEQPSVVIGTTDDTIRQIKGLANEVVANITTRGTSWAKLQKQATFTTVAAEEQGSMDTIAPYGFKYVIENSLFDRTERRPLYGPRNAPRWQEAEAIVQTGPFYSYRIWDNKFYLQPAPPAGHNCYFEYASDYAIQATGGGAYKGRFTADADVFLLSGELLVLGLKWKWRRSQGLSYAEEYKEYESFLAQEMGTEPTKGTVNLKGGTRDIRPGIFVPSGNWPV